MSIHPTEFPALIPFVTNHSSYTGCNNIWLDYYACVGVPGAATPMPDIVANCSRYCLVVSGDRCGSIATKNGITVANFRRWNTLINAACTNLWADVLVCTNAG